MVKLSNHTHRSSSHKFLTQICNGNLYSFLLFCGICNLKMVLKFLRSISEPHSYEKNNYFVYLYFDPNKLEIFKSFYVGTGCFMRELSHSISAILAAKFGIEIRSSKKLSKTDQFFRLNGLCIVKLIEKATMTEVKFIESTIINCNKFNSLTNINKEKSSLSLFQLSNNQKKLIDIINQHFNKAIENEDYQKVDYHCEDEFTSRTIQECEH